VSESGRESAEFLSHLRAEKLQAQTARTKYVTQKLAYAAGLLALGSLKPGSADLSGLLYLVPFLALAFDLYILGEDYSVKRIGLFFRRESTDELEKRWEDWVSENRDPFAQVALPILTSILGLAATLVLCSQTAPSAAKIPSWQWVTWLVLAFTPSWGLFIGYKCLLKRKKTKEESAGSQTSCARKWISSLKRKKTKEESAAKQ
jgi:hypothetical protein